MQRWTISLTVLLSAVLAMAAAPAQAQSPNPERNVYFGDTHAHSELSGDAYGFGNRLPPENAYRLARGEEVDHSGGYVHNECRSCANRRHAGLTPSLQNENSFDEVRLDDDVP